LQALSKLSKEYNNNPTVDLFKFAQEIVYKFHETDIKQIELSIGVIQENIESLNKLIAISTSDSEIDEYMKDINRLQTQLTYRNTDLNNLLGVPE
jgi:cupin superfamily acireductone dioxygenase involved in methionine salvage